MNINKYTNIDLKKLISKLYPYNYAINGLGNNQIIKILKKELNFKIHQFKEGSEINGWRIPKCQKTLKAIIKYNGKVILDNTNSPLGLILSCNSFNGKIKLKDLKRHLFFHSRNSKFVPFHCTKQYNFEKIDWGFCVTKKFFDSLNENGTYEVDIKIKYMKSSMKVFDYKIKGKSKKTILIQAHNCHPFQANDDLSGIAVGIRLMQILQLKKLYYSYRFIISPEITGTVFWLDKYKSIKNDFIGSIILPACGNSSDLKLQETFSANTFLDRVSHNIFKKYKNYKSGKFRTIHGNDETVFESCRI